MSSSFQDRRLINFKGEILYLSQQISELISLKLHVSIAHWVGITEITNSWLATKLSSFQSLHSQLSGSVT